MSQLCFTPPKYPLLFGGTGGSTYFNAIAMDSAGNLAVGGTSSDSSIVRNSWQPNPFMVFYEQSRVIRWYKNFDRSEDDIASITFSPDSTKLVFTTVPKSSRTYLVIVIPYPIYT